MGSHVELTACVSLYSHGAKPLQRQGKLHLVKGDSMLLPCCVAVSQSAMPVNLRLCCAAALVPHYPLTAVRKFPADHLLTHLNVKVYPSTRVLL